MGFSLEPRIKNDTTKLEILIDGRIYDITNFKHPGGSVINFYAGKGIDATEAFNNFHIRSKKAMTILKSKPNRLATPQDTKEKLDGQTELMKDFEKLTKELIDEGYFKPNMGHVVYRIMEIVFMHVAGFYLLFNKYLLFGLLLLGIVSGRCGWLMHEAGHYSLTGNIPIDRSLQTIIYGLGCGMSGSWWRNQHNKHHSMPQKISHDVDLDTLPLVAFTNKIGKQIGLPLKYWIRLQGFLFPIVTTLLVALGWQFYLHPRHVLRTRNYAEALCIGSRYVLWYNFISTKFGLYNSVFMYITYTWIASNYIFLNFAVSHTHLPVVAKHDVSVDWVRYSAIHTMNVNSGPLKFIDWWMSYLNYQIEHHLFPSMPQFRHPEISERVKQLFKKHKLPYNQRNYVDSMKITFKNLNNVGNDIFIG
jgi:acyl-CoA 6-desaturase (Delta-6 desaturase)